MEINNIIKSFKERAQKEMRRNIGGEFLPEPDYSGTSGTFEGRLSKLYPKDI